MYFSTSHHIVSYKLGVCQKLEGLKVSSVDARPSYSPVEFPWWASQDFPASYLLYIETWWSIWMHPLVHWKIYGLFPYKCRFSQIGEIVLERSGRSIPGLCIQQWWEVCRKIPQTWVSNGIHQVCCSIHSYIHDSFAFIVQLHWNFSASMKKRGVHSPILQSPIRFNLTSFFPLLLRPCKKD